MDLKHIIGQFIEGDTWREAEPFGNGHINDTFRIRVPNGHDLLLQKINHFVFTDVNGLMCNIDLVTNHIYQKNLQNNSGEVENKSLSLLKTTEGKLFWKDEAGCYWRMMNFIEDSQAFERAPDANIAFEGARMFGVFLQQLVDLDPAKLVETIPDFHNIDFRLKNLDNAANADVVGRARQVREELRYVHNAAPVMRTIRQLGQKGVLPARITHNDTKINNVLFDRQGRGLCVVDLDTVMPGYAHYDFGDLVRTGACPAEEDDKDRAAMVYDLAIFEALAAGFLEATRSMMSDAEITSLSHAALLFPFIMGVRFLTDYLAGDVYYKIKYPEHNLVRARAQLHLASDGQQKQKDMQSIIDKYYKTS